MFLSLVVSRYTRSYLINKIFELITQKINIQVIPLGVKEACHLRDRVLCVVPALGIELSDQIIRDRGEAGESLETALAG